MGRGLTGVRTGEARSRGSRLGPDGSRCGARRHSERLPRMRGRSRAGRGVGIPADVGRLLAGLPPAASGVAAPAGGAPRAGLEQAQPGHAVQEKHALGARHVVAEHRERVHKRVADAAVAKTPATPTTTAPTRTTSPRMTTLLRQPASGQQERAAGKGAFTSESSAPAPSGKQPIRKRLITVADRPGRVL